MAAGPLAFGTTYTWNNTTGVWSDASKWGGTAPTGTDSTDILVFGGSGGTGYTATNDLAGQPFLLNQLRLESTASAANTLAGGTLRFSGASPQLQQNNAGAFTITAGLDFAAATTLGGSGGGAVALSGVLSGGAGLTINNTAATPATVTLGNASNTFFGGFTVTSGTPTTTDTAAPPPPP